MDLLTVDSCCALAISEIQRSTPLKFNIAPENEWLEDEFSFGMDYFSEAMLQGAYSGFKSTFVVFSWQLCGLVKSLFECLFSVLYRRKGRILRCMSIGPLCGMSLEGVAVLADREINGVTVDGTSEAHLVPFATSWPVQPNVTRPEK